MARVTNSLNSVARYIIISRLPVLSDDDTRTGPANPRQPLKILFPAFGPFFNCRHFNRYTSFRYCGTNCRMIGRPFPSKRNVQRPTIMFFPNISAILRHLSLSLSRYPRFVFKGKGEFVLDELEIILLPRIEYSISHRVKNDVLLAIHNTS